MFWKVLSFTGFNLCLRPQKTLFNPSFQGRLLIQLCFRSNNIEFIPPNSILCPSLPMFFTTDLVHLTPPASNTLSYFIKNILLKKSVVCPTLDLNQASSIYQWSIYIKHIPPTRSSTALIILLFSVA